MSPNLSPKTLAHRVGERWLIFFFLLALAGTVIGGWRLFERWTTPPTIVIVPPPPTLAIPHPQPTIATKNEIAPVVITVMVSGAVEKPGLYELPAGSTVADAIAIAGGLTAQANVNSLETGSKLNDGMVLAIPISPNGETENGGSALINLNHATLKELESLPGIGRVTAQAIIDNRPYRRLSDLNRVSGIGEATINQLRGLVTVDEE